MNEQRDLFGRPVTPEALREQHKEAFEDASKRSIDERFRQFHAANPLVYEELVRLARIAKTKGRLKLGIKMIWEVMRWNRLTTTLPNTEDDFKLSNDFHSRYARLIMKTEPDLSDFFETRELRSE